MRIHLGLGDSAPIEKPNIRTRLISETDHSLTGRSSYTKPAYSYENVSGVRESSLQILNSQYSWYPMNVAVMLK